MLRVALVKPASMRMAASVPWSSHSAVVSVSFSGTSTPCDSAADSVAVTRTGEPSVTGFGVADSVTVACGFCAACGSVPACCRGFLACWFGRAQEMQFFNDRIDLKMYFYIVGGTMLSLNAFSGAVWHYDNFDDPNPGAYLFAAFFTFYVFDYFVFERVQLYTYDVIYERLGFNQLPPDGRRQALR